MKPEVVVILVVNLLPFHSQVVSAAVDIAASSSLTASQPGRAVIVGGSRLNDDVRAEGFDARRRRSLADEAGYRDSERVGDARPLRGALSVSRNDEKHLREVPDVADTGDADTLWNNGGRKANLLLPPHLVGVRHWGEPDISWLRRRIPEFSRPPVAAFRPSPSRRRVGWSEAGMDWIKRRATGLRHGPCWSSGLAAWRRRRLTVSLRACKADVLLANQSVPDQTTSRSQISGGGQASLGIHGVRVAEAKPPAAVQRRLRRRRAAGPEL